MGRREDGVLADDVVVDVVGQLEAGQFDSPLDLEALHGGTSVGLDLWLRIRAGAQL
jgi:hypothetical protein